MSDIDGVVEVDYGSFWVQQHGDDAPVVYDTSTTSICTPFRSRLGFGVSCGRQMGTVPITATGLDTPPPELSPTDLVGWDVAEEFSLDVVGEMQFIDSTIGDYMLDGASFFAAHGWTRFRVRTRGRDFTILDSYDDAERFDFQAWAEPGPRPPRGIGSDQGTTY